MEILLLALFIAIAFIVTVSIAQRSEPIAAGKVAPQFRLLDQHGKSVEQPLQNQKTIIAFFPRDNTSRCLTEIQDFMRLKQDFAALGWQIVLVAIADATDNCSYATKHAFDLMLLADEKGKVSRQYGSIIDFGFYRFAKRITFAVNADGKISATYIVAEPAGHVEQVLQDLRQL